MAINYALHENHLTTDPNDYNARVISGQTADMKALIDRMVDRGSTVVRADILSVLEDFNAAVESLVLEGRNVTTPLCNFAATVKGVFNGITDTYDSSRHQVLPTVSPGQRLRNAVAQRATVAKIEALRATPAPQDYVDVATGERNSVLSTGGMGQLLGHRLKFDAAQPEQGVFFRAADGTETRVEMVGRNKPGDLMFMTPVLAAGEYVLIVRAVFGETDLREGELPHLLTVSA